MIRFMIVLAVLSVIVWVMKMIVSELTYETIKYTPKEKYNSHDNKDYFIIIETRKNYFNEVDRRVHGDMIGGFTYDTKDIAQEVCDRLTKELKKK